MRWILRIGVVVAVLFVASPAWAQTIKVTLPLPPLPLPTDPTESPSPLPSDSPSPSDTPTDPPPSPTDPPTSPTRSPTAAPPTKHPPQPPTADHHNGGGTTGDTSGSGTGTGYSYPSGTPAGPGGFAGGFLPARTDAGGAASPSPSDVVVSGADGQPQLPAETGPLPIPTDEGDPKFVAAIAGVGVVVFAVAAFAGWHWRD